jgi:hypothetical protein
MKLNYFINAVLLVMCIVFAVSAQNYKIAQTGKFAPQNKKILLLKEPSGKNSVILFQTTLRVNTDGSPLSYSPADPLGESSALNNVCNAVAVIEKSTGKNLCFKNFSKAIGIFKQWRDTKFKTVPAGFSITWQNVLAAVKENGVTVPCIFKAGDFVGHFGSLTALKNDLTGDKGECEVDNQVNSMTVPALVLVGGANDVKNFGAKVGDLLIAFNPKTNIVSAAIIGDTGPKDNLGEGSVFLNMKLLGTTTAPTKKSETFKLSIENTQILIAIIPASRLFQIDGNKPYTAANIDKRIADWQAQAGFTSAGKFLDFMKSFQPKLN